MTRNNKINKNNKITLQMLMIGNKKQKYKKRILLLNNMNQQMIL